jgi:5-methylcytosine-specific restriction endonuclease McrA
LDAGAILMTRDQLNRYRDEIMKRHRDREAKYLWPSLIAWSKGDWIADDPDLPPEFWGFDGRQHPERLTATAWRRYRECKARRLGTHTEQEWLILLEQYRCCALCGRSEVELVKDHITPIARGGCDCIHNIQPLCHRCNSRKGSKRLV